MENMETLVMRAVYLQSEVDSLKSNVEAVLKDQSISLEQRWNFFKELPDYLGNTETWIQTFDGIDSDTSWYDEFHVERHTTVHMKAFVEMLKESKWDADENGEGNYPHDIDRVKEDILQRNLVSFVYDW